MLVVHLWRPSPAPYWIKRFQRRRWICCSSELLTQLYLRKTFSRSQSFFCEVAARLSSWATAKESILAPSIAANWAAFWPQKNVYGVIVRFIPLLLLNNFVVWVPLEPFFKSLIEVTDAFDYYMTTRIDVLNPLFWFSDAFSDLVLQFL